MWYLPLCHLGFSGEVIDEEVLYVKEIAFVAMPHISHKLYVSKFVAQTSLSSLGTVIRALRIIRTRTCVCMDVRTHACLRQEKSQHHRHADVSHILYCAVRACVRAYLPRPNVTDFEETKSSFNFRASLEEGENGTSSVLQSSSFFPPCVVL